ncbi:homeobox-like domain superfamily [Holotrichia oblita]|uniref:Homeobox-like domain superfamily n=1 Tax=Holotrichia oblita TaxID=644536 RepID=A0ACB9TZ10_HOLOL|nr:homeobox-like domain superfamily [Holotrichia oblita]
MVRNYIRKTRRGDAYSPSDLDHVVNSIKTGAMTIYRAHKMYGIPKTTLYYHVTGKRGSKSRTQGRPPAIPPKEEEKLGDCIKTMEKWGFGLSRREVIEVVSQYVTENKIQCPFKNNIPGDEWFSSLKKRQNLSIKKPQAVEYPRKKMTDPFIVYRYFSLLKSTLDQLELHDKPNRIWNLDETSFSHDPCKTKIVGARGIQRC